MTSGAFVIALDGPAASGKSTVGLGAARELGLRYFDSGLLYRALTWLAQVRGIDTHDADAVTRLVGDLNLDIDDVGNVWRDGSDVTPELHSPEVDANVSTVAAHSTVRLELVHVQRDLVRPPGLVLAGRDIGTVIVPDAPLKIWLNAGVDERARRRAEQTGEDFASVLESMRKRDHVDSSRAVAPMTRAEMPSRGHGRVDATEVIARIVELARQTERPSQARRPGRTSAAGRAPQHGAHGASATATMSPGRPCPRDHVRSGRTLRRARGPVADLGQAITLMLETGGQRAPGRRPMNRCSIAGHPCSATGLVKR